MRDLTDGTGTQGALGAALAWIERLVGFDTTSRHSNLGLITDLEAHLAGLGIAATRIPNATGDKTNLLFSVGPAVAGGVVLSGHTDVVPVDGQAWTSDPWTLVERDGRLYGRGTADMKSFIAIALSLLPRMQAAGLKRPIQFALSYDEEIGLFGAPAMIDHIVAHLPPPDAVIVGEPTGMQVVDRHKGIVGLRTRVTGHEAHSSQTHLGVSATMVAIDLLAHIQSLARELAAGPVEANGLMPPHTTITVGLLQGGTAANILARSCEFIWDIRPAPGQDAGPLVASFRERSAQLEGEMRARFPDCAIETAELSNAPPLRPNPGGAAVRLATALTGANRTQAVAYVAEAGQFQRAGLDTVICGPGFIAQAHQPDEYIDRSQVAAGLEFTEKLIKVLSA